MKKIGILKKLVGGDEINLEEANFIGDTSNANLGLPFKYVFKGDIFIGNKLYSENRRRIAPIVCLEKDLVAKRKKSDTYFRNEAQNLKFANSRELPLVGLHGRFNVYNFRQNSFEEALILDKIPGMTYFEKKETLGFFGKRKIKKKYSDAINKTSYYFEMQDSHEGNAIYDDVKDKVVLIDPEYWNIKKLK